MSNNKLETVFVLAMAILVCFTMFVCINAAIALQGSQLIMQMIK